MPKQELLVPASAVNRIEVWGGHSCPPLVKWNWIVVVMSLSEFCGYPKSKVKSGGQECPPHTDSSYFAFPGLAMTATREVTFCPFSMP
ncbi:MAG: hypothetical protein ACXVZH_16505, partial [Terriglobales bacterium]